MIIIQKNIKFHTYLRRVFNTSWPFIFCAPLPFFFYGSSHLLAEIIFSLGILAIGYIQSFNVAKTFIEKINIGADTATIIYYSFSRKMELIISKKSISACLNKNPVSVQMVDLSSLVIRAENQKIVQFSFFGWSKNDFEKIISDLDREH